MTGKRVNMADPIGCETLIGMLQAAAAQIRGHHEELSRLDSFGGDGDHGATMLRAVRRVEEAVADGAARTPAKLLEDVGWAIMGVDGGATGPLLGSLFTGMAEAAGDAESLDCRRLAAAFDAVSAAVGRRTKAQAGDKTMLDALLPAVAAFRECAEAGASVSDALARAAEAAAAGAAATAGMQARFGRAKHLGARSVGQQDPGAKSIALMFKGFAEGV